MSLTDVRRITGASKARRTIAAVTLAIATVVAASGCSQVAVAPQGNCSPEYKVGGSEGSLSVRQDGKGKAIAWGIYVASQYKVGTIWNVKVYANGTKIDAKVDQPYEPHGSINADRALKYSGKTLEISGTAKHNDDVLTFSGKCTIA